MPEIQSHMLCVIHVSDLSVLAGWIYDSTDTSLLLLLLSPCTFLLLPPSSSSSSSSSLSFHSASFLLLARAGQRNLTTMGALHLLTEEEEKGEVPSGWKTKKRKGGEKKKCRHTQHKSAVAWRKVCEKLITI